MPNRQRKAASRSAGRIAFSGRVLGDGRLGHRKTELEQLAMNARCTPKHIFNAHPPDQCSQIGTDLRASSQVSRFATPVAAKTGTMPAHQGLGPDVYFHSGKGRRSTAPALQPLRRKFVVDDYSHGNAGCRSSRLILPEGDKRIA